MSAHTPGPWVLSGWTAPDDYGWSIKVGDAPYRIEVSAWSASSEADARLIAAAPDLYEAARRFLLEFDVRRLSSSVAFNDKTPSADAVTAFLDAVAKAEGKP